MTLTMLALLFQVTTAAPQPEVSRCFSPFRPVALGSEWQYRGETKAISPGAPDTTDRYERIERIAALTPASMSVRMAMRSTSSAPFANTTEYRCGDDGVVLAPTTMSGYTMKYFGSEDPKKVEKGTKWESSTVMTLSDGTGNRTINRYEILGTETIVVPAGRFDDAIKVAYEQVNERIDPDPKKLAQYNRMTANLQMSMKGVRWYAPQVGQVRSEFVSATTLNGKPHTHVEGFEELVSFRP